MNEKINEQKGHATTPVASREATGCPELEKGSVGRVRDRADRAIAATPGLGDVRRRLLERGGREVALFWHEPQVGQLLVRGRDFEAAGSDSCTMAPSSCHGNVALLWRLSGGEVGI